MAMPCTTLPRDASPSTTTQRAASLPLHLLRDEDGDARRHLRRGQGLGRVAKHVLRHGRRLPRRQLPGRRLPLHRVLCHDKRAGDVAAPPQLAEEFDREDPRRAVLHLGLPAHHVRHAMRVGNLCPQLVRVAAVEKDELEPPALPLSRIAPDRVGHHVRLDCLRPAPRLREAERFLASPVAEHAEAGVGVAGEEEVARVLLGELGSEVVGGAAAAEDNGEAAARHLRRLIEHVGQRHFVGAARHYQQGAIEARLRPNARAAANRGAQRRRRCVAAEATTAAARAARGRCQRAGLGGSRG
mmetsp:Transcript_43137/g.139926  ORF Transcript_43137/g.139926 Transcript_43137/m.139926 type:complete len:299 (-) Transcript_43137:2269-3165(-)